VASKGQSELARESLGKIKPQQLLMCKLHAPSTIFDTSRFTVRIDYRAILSYVGVPVQ